MTPFFWSANNANSMDLGLFRVYSGLLASRANSNCMGYDDMNANSGHKLAHSRCAMQSRQRELERLRRMTIEDRVRSALTMGSRFAWIRPVAAGQRS